MYLTVAHQYTSSKLLDQITKNRITELLVISKTIVYWQLYSQQRKSIRRGLLMWKNNAAKRRNIRIKYNRVFLIVAFVLKWKKYILLRKNLRTVISLLEASICSICYSAAPNFLSRCKHTFCRTFQGGC